MGEPIQYIYAALSMIVVALVLVFGVWGSQYVPRQREKPEETEGGKPDVSTD